MQLDSTQSFRRSWKTFVVHGWHTNKCPKETLHRDRLQVTLRSHLCVQALLMPYLDLNIYHLLEGKTISLSKISGKLPDLILFCSLWFWLPVIARAFKSKVCEHQLKKQAKSCFLKRKNQGQLTTQDIFSKIIGQTENVDFQILTVAAIVCSS